MYSEPKRSLSEQRVTQRLLSQELEKSIDLDQHPHTNRFNSFSEKRDKWNNDLQYYMSVLGYTVGYGSLWRFPYLMYSHGGGVFLIPYTIFVVVLAIPCFALETSLGQIFQRSIPFVLEQQIHIKYKGIGIWMIFTTFLFASFYNLIQTYSLIYLYYSFKTPLPWTIYNAPINNTTINNISINNSTISTLDTNQLINDTKIVSNTQINNIIQSSSSFFYQNVLNSSPSINNIGSLNIQLYFTYLCCLIFTFLIISKGPSLSGKIAVITASAPYILLFILLLYGFTLENTFKGISLVFFEMQFNKLFTIQIWIDAIIQVAFQFGTGTAVLVSLSSFRRKEQSITRISLYVISGIYLCGLLGAVVIFQYLAHIVYKSGMQFSDLKLEGPELCFIVYPSALSLLPMGNFFSIIFFLVFFMLGIDTMMGFLEAINAYIHDEFRDTFIFEKYISKHIPEFVINHVRIFNKVVLILIIGIFGIFYSFGFGFYLLQQIDKFNGTIGLLGTIIALNILFNFLLTILEKTTDEVPIVIAFSLRYLILPVMILMFVVGIFQLIVFSFSIQIQVSLLLWLLMLCPLFYSYRFYTQNKHQVKIDFRHKLQESSEKSNYEMANIKYFQYN